MRTRPLVIGHRGNAGPAPANTLAAYREAIQMGLNMIEVDLRITRDGTVVMLHDETVDDTTDGQGRLADLTLADLRRLDAGSWKSEAYAGERIPTLEETLQIAQGRIHLSLDLKDTRAIGPMAEAVREWRMLDQVVVCGCTVDTATMVREMEPRLTVVLNMDEPMTQLARSHHERFVDVYVAQAAQNHLAALNMHYNYVTPKLVRKAHLHGLPVWAWTVDEPIDIHRMIDFGVDAIYSNWPERVLKALDGTAIEAG